MLVHGSPTKTATGISADLAVATGDSSGAMTATAVFG
jgi:hypothetical protein